TARPACTAGTFNAPLARPGLGTARGPPPASRVPWRGGRSCRGGVSGGGVLFDLSPDAPEGVEPPLEEEAKVRRLRAPVLLGFERLNRVGVADVIDELGQRLRAVLVNELLRGAIPLRHAVS